MRVTDAALARPLDVRALEELGAAIRGVGYDCTPAAGPLAMLALGHPVARDELAAPVSLALIDDLVAHGHAAPEGKGVRLRFGVIAAGDVLIAFPATQQATPDMVYTGPDSLLLLEAMRRLAPRGRRAADLGTGTGLLAAISALTYESVVATDITRRSCRAAATTFALNESAAGPRPRPLLTDVGQALRRRAFDVVVANAPWVATTEGDERGARIFADGGPTGFELPRRFALEAAELLADDGVGLVCMSDLTYDDGRRPLADLVAELNDARCVVIVVPTPFATDIEPKFEAAAKKRQPSLIAADHVVAVIARCAPTSQRALALRSACDSLARRWGREVCDVTLATLTTSTAP